MNGIRNKINDAIHFSTSAQIVLTVDFCLLYSIELDINYRSDEHSTEALKQFNDGKYEVKICEIQAFWTEIHKKKSEEFWLHNFSRKWSEWNFLMNSKWLT